MTLGIGGAGSKIAYKYDPRTTILNVSETELNKLPCENRILAVVHSANGQLRGSRKSPQIGRDAFLSVKREILHLIRGNFVFSSTGGGTGNGITASILEDLAARDDVPSHEKTMFGLILPYANLEPAEFVTNTTNFLQGPLSQAIDSGNTGNICLFSNQLKFESRLAEDDYNQMLMDSLNVFMSIPEKSDALTLVDGHIDYEDFAHYTAKPYFNHFTYFDYDPETAFDKQFKDNLNPYLLAPDTAIEALFMLEVPPGTDASFFYDILQYFAESDVSPDYGVVENPELDKPFINVSVLYSRKPTELVEDFNRISHQHTQAKLRKSLKQHVSLPRLEVNLENEAKKAAEESGAADSDILGILKRLGKL
ncbi:MAG: hypothetical protein R6V56_06220 [Lentisphaeria bacterium]